MSSTKILLVDDDPLFTEQVAALLDSEDYNTCREHNSNNVINLIKNQNPDLILLDIQMPGLDGITLLKQIMALPDHPQVIMFSGAASLQQAADSIKLGAADFLEKPPDVKRLLITVKNCLEQQRLILENRLYKNNQLKKYEIIGQSQAVVSLISTIKQIAQSDSRVLIWGETGTGKELAASQLHYYSQRSAAALIKVNCAAIPHELAESELFGHKKGAFTGAYIDKTGKFELANSGTMVLDEITELPLSIQSKLLRVLESSEIEMVGSTKSTAIDFRLISISGKNIEDLVAENKFRSDLYYRINTIPVYIPPLRDRLEDIPLLLDYFFDQLKEKTSRWDRSYDPDIISILAAQDWPGNIRQFKNIIEKIFYLSLEKQISKGFAEDIISAKSQINFINPNDTSDKNLLTATLENFERNYLKANLSRTNKNIAELAKRLGLDRGNLYKKLKKYNLL